MRLIDAEALKRRKITIENEWHMHEDIEVVYADDIDNAHTIDLAKEKDFVNEIIGYIFAYPDDDYMLMETLCRKLHKHGLLDKKDGEWICDTPQNERSE